MDVNFSSNFSFLTDYAFYFILQLQFDEEEGVELGCDENPLDIDAVANHIYWPRDLEKRRKSFSIFRNLERNLQNEDRFQKKFFFHIYFTSKNGRLNYTILKYKN